MTRAGTQTPSAAAAASAAPPPDAAPRYQTGFGNHFSTEALPRALPEGGNSPQRPPYGLYAEQLSGTAFTTPRADNRHAWLYRIHPSAQHAAYRRMADGGISHDYATPTPPNRLRWDPRPLPTTPTDFIDGWYTLAGHGDPATQSGAAVHLYTANTSMQRRVFHSADGELLIVPQLGLHRFVTEFGVIDAEPQQIVLIPRGVRFRVEVVGDSPLRGYICEHYGAPLRLPDLGPIGSNGPASPRDFETPVAAYEDADAPHQLVCKFMGHLWQADCKHSPLDVVAWHGNLAPCRYDLRRYNAIGSISRDHPDPSIFLLLHAPSAVPGTSDLDFVVFPPRILLMHDTFRPPWFHRNVASELMGLVHGAYDAKAQGFVPGGASLHNCMAAHGPDAATYERARNADLSVPDVIRDTMAFMFESRCAWRPTTQALAVPELQQDYDDCWQALARHFDPKVR